MCKVPLKRNLMVHCPLLTLTVSIDVHFQWYLLAKERAGQGDCHHRDLLATVDCPVILAGCLLNTFFRCSD